MTPSALYLIQLHLDLPSLYRLSRTRHLTPREVDLGYVVHTALDSLFGAAVVRPFVIPQDNPLHPTGREGVRWLEVLGYSSLSAEALRQQAQQLALPELFGILGPLYGKVMPNIWPKDTEIRFGVRACPVVRTRDDQTGRTIERDAFLAAISPTGENQALLRAEVYAKWLKRHLDQSQALHEEMHIEVEGLKLARLQRRTHHNERKSHRNIRPDVWFDVHAKVADDNALRTLLAHGVGRHRAFGFGMMWVRHKEREG